MTRARSHFGIVVLALAALIATASASQNPTPPNRRYSVGVVRADGALVPFAEYDRGTWKPFWNGVDRSSKVSLPLTLEDVNPAWWGGIGPALQWMLWREAADPAPLNVTSTRVVSAPCRVQPALSTDFVPSSALPPPDQTPYPKAGIATTTPIQFEPIRQVPADDVDWQRVKRALDTRDFRNAENLRLNDMEWAHPVSSSVRNTTPIDLQAVWHVKDSRFFYVEAMRRYPDPKPPKGKPPCDLVTYVAGYYWEERSEQLRPVRLMALISYCHMERASFLWPFGVIREGARQFWVFQSAGWTAESYGISEPLPSRGQVLTRVWHLAGWCE